MNENKIQIKYLKYIVPILLLVGVGFGMFVYTNKGSGKETVQTISSSISSSVVSSAKNEENKNGVFPMLSNDKNLNYYINLPQIGNNIFDTEMVKYGEDAKNRITSDSFSISSISENDEAWPKDEMNIHYEDELKSDKIYSLLLTGQESYGNSSLNIHEGRVFSFSQNKFLSTNDIFGGENIDKVTEKIYLKISQNDKYKDAIPDDIKQSINKILDSDKVIYINQDKQLHFAFSSLDIGPNSWGSLDFDMTKELGEFVKNKEVLSYIDVKNENISKSSTSLSSENKPVSSEAKSLPATEPIKPETPKPEIKVEVKQEEKKNVDIIAKEVLDGKWGNAEERKNKLKQAGYEYSQVQAKVNEILNSNTSVQNANTQIAQPLTTSLSAGVTTIVSDGSVNCAVLKCVALTFDDGPSAHTPELLNILKDNGVHATFFVIGQNAARYRDVVKRAYDEGNQIGDHTYTHINLNNASDEAGKNEIEKTANLVRDIIQNPNYHIVVRAPYGAISGAKANTLGYSFINWNVDPDDWRDKNTQLVIDRVLKNVKPGSIVLSHDIYPTTVEAYKTIIPELKKQGYTLVTINQMFGSLESGKRYFGQNDYR